MSKRILVSLSDYQRQQLDKLKERKAFTTINQAIRSGVDLLLRKESVKRWDNQVFFEYEAGMMSRHHRSGVLLSIRFQKELNYLVKNKAPQLKRGVWNILRKISQEENSNLEVKQLEFKDYFLVGFVFLRKKWSILIRYHDKEIIACRIIDPTNQVWFE
ncbi:MAG: hypothetical protein HN846_03260 [Candidatus Pacebacteria bacterium]|jgi:Arc/MetJ-type ribon-helix-helix transcriptional regulator|nr:hypothetical protein [Candidatus Paceibacterota bacterium]MBT3511811.1 hypothetical protein [Candidatus Paceibacterota bacterium]MBT4005067.1 hypothetical protein [Candidatus Paceibacterota bacterium]MBT4358448.1 hypothetical protein [Candidatus Paceibacterota bacterium]MBT4680557.1 hypothetical protein [Candidatus Paceibacterota bacterium]